MIERENSTCMKASLRAHANIRTHMHTFALSITHTQRKQQYHPSPPKYAVQSRQINASLVLNLEYYTHAHSVKAFHISLLIQMSIYWL